MVRNGSGRERERRNRRRGEDEEQEEERKKKNQLGNCSFALVKGGGFGGWEKRGLKKCL